MSIKFSKTYSITWWHWNPIKHPVCWICIVTKSDTFCIKSLVMLLFFCCGNDEQRRLLQHICTRQSCANGNLALSEIKGDIFSLFSTIFPVHLANLKTVCRVHMRPCRWKSEIQPPLPIFCTLYVSKHFFYTSNSVLISHGSQSHPSRVRTTQLTPR